MTTNGWFLTWLALSAPLAVAALVVVVLAIRSGQFRGQEHARRLPLEIPDDPVEGSPVDA